MTVDLRRMPVVREEPLGKQGACGMAEQLQHSDPGTAGYRGPPTIYLDPRMRDTRHELETLIHEALHLACPWMYEPVVTATARYISMVVWKMGFRRQ